MVAAEGFKFDVAFTSTLKRAIRTLDHALEETDHMWIPVTKAWQLNERHYGGLQGLDKQQTVDKHGIEQVTVWRRSYDIPPPDSDKSSEHWPGRPRWRRVGSCWSPVWRWQCWRRSGAGRAVGGDSCIGR